MNGKDFKKWCKERRLTVNEVAEMFDVGLSTIFRYFKTGGEIPKTISMYIEIENNISGKIIEKFYMAGRREYRKQPCRRHPIHIPGQGFGARFFRISFLRAHHYILPGKFRRYGVIDLRYKRDS